MNSTAAANPLASLPNLPVELHIEIQSYLSHIDIERLSRCSTTLRSVSLPQVFRSAQISPESLQFFTDAGILQRLHSCVRHITILPPSSTPSQITDLYALLSSIALFTRPTSLKLTYNAPVEHSQSAVFAAVFSGIYGCKFFPFLKQLSLTIGHCEEDHVIDPSVSSNLTPGLLNLNLSAGTVPLRPSLVYQAIKKRHNYHRYDIDRAYEGNIITIPTLQTAKLKLHKDSLFSFDERPFFPHASNPSDVFSLSRSTTRSLKILHLQIPNFVFPDELTTGIPNARAESRYINNKKYTTYPTVKELHFTIDSLKSWQLRDITRRFRNLTVFLVKETQPGQLWEDIWTARPFKDIARMRKLKTLWLPWVKLNRGRAAKWKLESAVSYWVSKGLDDLEDI
ncbi:hypothetical protein TWF481_005313 [Arthrobotrys musiformis]|uniref:F-box domain-containing protein n=1 Tax=Arthrobotrys musiformis TaxID=47236 RepID=A0AAV9WDH0_9PEZI